MQQPTFEADRADNNSGFPNGPKGWPILGVSHQMLNDSLGTFDRITAEYGPIASLPIPGHIGVLVSEPELIQHVLLQTEKSNTKSGIYARIRDALGDGLVTAVGQNWQSLREPANPFFTPKAALAMQERFSEQVIKICDSWQKHPADKSVPISFAMLDMTMNIINEMMFSKAIDNNLKELSDAVDRIQEYTASIFWSPFVTPRWIPTKGNREFNKAIKVVDDHLYPQIKERMSLPHDQQAQFTDLLQNYLDNESFKKLPNQATVIRDQLLTMLIAGHDTTAHSMSYTLFLLAQNQDWQSKLYEELKDASQEELRDLKAVRKYELLNQVIFEAMRFYPPAWAINRESITDLVFGKYHFPKGTTFFLSMHNTHRDSRFWEKPNTFHPPHFKMEAVKARPKFAYFPFGGGPRNCIGQHMALAEILLGVAQFVKRFRFREKPGFSFRPTPRITLAPVPGIELLVEKR